MSVFYNKTNKRELIELSTIYLKYRNCFNNGFQRYSYYKNLIKHITGLNFTNHVRHIFNSLINKGFIDVKKHHGKIYYRFNPYQKKDIPETENFIIVKFD